MTENQTPTARPSVVATMLKVLAAATVCGVLVMIGIIHFYTPASEAQRLVPTENAEYPRLKYADSLTSVNDRCIVAQRPLNKNVDPVYVNGRPVGFC